MPYLACKNPDGSVNEFWNLHDSPTIVGRSTTAKASVDDPDLSREHFSITEEPGRFVLKDLGSTNGTRVNGKPVTEHILKANDTIHAGKSTFVFMEGLTTMSMKLDQDLKDLDRITKDPKAP